MEVRQKPVTQPAAVDPQSLFGGPPALQDGLSPAAGTCRGSHGNGPANKGHPQVPSRVAATSNGVRTNNHG